MEGDKRGWAHKRQTSLTQAYNNLYPDISASIPGVTTLRSMYVFSVYNKFFLVACFVNSSPEITFQISVVFSTKFAFIGTKCLTCT
jgi:hypothetical protein